MRFFQSHRSTLLSCYNGYIVQAICINLPPLLFLTFQRVFFLSLGQISVLIVGNTLLQLSIDLLASRIGGRIHPRIILLTAHFFAALGLIGLSVLPFRMDPFAGLLISVALLGVGGGLIEVMVSPLVEACPTEGKGRNMSFLHSFYSWGQASVVFLSGLWFLLLDIDTYWRWLPLLWAIIPLVGFVAFCLVPIYQLPAETESGMTAGKLFKSHRFRLFLLMMVCAGASELVMGQWASSFAESALGVNKTVGDLFGPGTFAAAMGLARILSGKLSGKVRTSRLMMASSLLCALSYLIAVFAPVAWLSLFGCMLCGFSVGIFWPGILSEAASRIPNGGISMFAILALAGDVGCLSGPSLAGGISDLAGGNLRAGFLFAILFPTVMLAALLMQEKSERSASANHSSKGED